jgi:signal transduction histidine kinase/CheY-like chemotaxis protein
MLEGGWRSVPIAVFGIALLILLAGIGVILQYNVSYGRERIEQMQGLADILAASAAAPVDFNDPVAAQEAVDAFQVSKQVRWIGVFSRDGKILAGYDRTGAPVPPSIAAIQESGDGMLRVSATIEKAGQRIGTVYLEAERETGSRRVARFLLLIVLTLGTAFIVVGLGIAQAQLRSANRQLADRAEALAQANAMLGEQIEERAKAEEQLRQSQKMQALGQLTGGIAHDFNNLLTVIQGSADMLCRPAVTEAKRVRFAQAIVQAATNAASLTSQLLAFARRQPLKPEQLDMNALVREMGDLIDRTMGERIRVVTELHSTACRVEVDRAQLQSAILNICTNASDAMPDGGVLTILTRDVEGEDGGRMIALDVADTGEGMDSEVMDRIFEPFFTTKVTGKGTGLGLSQVYGFASQSGGDVRAESVPGKGATITLLLPCVATEELDLQSPDEPDVAEQPPAAILIVEDNDEVGAFAETMLAELGHRVTRASSGEEALDLTRKQRFDVVLSDVVMPGMGGLKLAEALASEQPDLPVVLATGYSQEISEAGSGGRPVILKPYRLATLSQALSSARRKANFI